ncbi:MAG: hypothetical protein CME93_03415 [Hyphomonadaceae bacterium]|nr:hypothetical protein [Hyphomonadaceae bacterium]OUX94450.1 MAG: hypothetical protein CBB77_05000 [Hyphomonas sp. TMED17]
MIAKADYNYDQYMSQPAVVCNPDRSETYRGDLGRIIIDESRRRVTFAVADGLDRYGAQVVRHRHARNALGATDPQG